MPSAKRHLQIELLLLPLALTLFHLFWEGIWELMVFGLSYLFSSLMLSPDLDLPHCRALKRWGWLQTIWLPYQKIFKHRGISHNLILGPLIRIVYLLASLSSLLLILSYLLSLIKFPLFGTQLSFPVIMRWIPSVFIGLYFPNFIHIICDKLFTYLRLCQVKRRLL